MAKPEGRGGRTLPRHTELKGKWFHYRRRVPTWAKEVDGRVAVRQALKTDSEEVARQKAARIDAELEAWWSLGKTDPAAAQDRHAAIVKIARTHGFEYKTVVDIASGDLLDILKRLERLEAMTAPGQEPAGDLMDALLGGSEPPLMTLSEAFRAYFETSGDKTHGKSPHQVRRWRNDRETAARLATEVMGDKPVSSLKRPDLLAWRQALWARVEGGEISADSANKQISYVSAMLRDVRDRFEVTLPDLSDLKFKASHKEVRSPFEPEFIQSRFLATGALDGLNEQARRIVFAMIETGISISECVNIIPENICLSAEIPHLKIRATAERALKTHARPRDIPLVGASLMAFQSQPEGFPRYIDRNDLASATINKFLQENDFRPTRKHSAYSFRHSFEDRMIAAGGDERMRSELMGHAYKREKYGQGPTLQAKLELLERMAFTPPGRV